MRADLQRLELAELGHADLLGIGHSPVGTALTRPILSSELAQIRELDASSRQITDLSGLELLFNLESLNLSNNNISRLTVTDAKLITHGAAIADFRFLQARPATMSGSQSPD